MPEFIKMLYRVVRHGVLPDSNAARQRGAPAPVPECCLLTLLGFCFLVTVFSFEKISTKENKIKELKMILEFKKKGPFFLIV